MAEDREGSFIDGFHGHWRRSSESVDAAIKTYVIALDTNVILEMYRMDPAAREELFNVLTAVKDRLWIPYQVALEFHRNRLPALSSYLKNTRAAAKEVLDAAEALKKALQGYAASRSLRGPRRVEFLNPLERKVSDVSSMIDKDIATFDLSLELVANKDPILSRLATILDGRVGPPLPKEEEKEVRQEGKRRVEERIPPGYKDADKSDGGLGDYAIWHEMVKHARKRRIHRYY